MLKYLFYCVYGDLGKYSQPLQMLVYIGTVQQHLLGLEMFMFFDTEFLHLGIYPTDIHVKNQVYEKILMVQTKVSIVNLRLLS